MQNEIIRPVKYSLVEHSVEQNKSTTATSKKSSFFGMQDPAPFFMPLLIQPKLTIGGVDDPHEKEADAIADKIMRMDDKEMVHTKLSPVNIQRKCSSCEEEDKLQMKGSPGAISGMVAPSSVCSAVHSAGRGLDAGTRNFMEARFGYDFSGVQIHDDPSAHQSSAEINALAFTHGNHVVFGQNQYKPETDAGKRLLAHELTHVVQQGLQMGSSIQRAPDTWYRGEGAGVKPASPGGVVHDFGDGLYLTDSSVVAKLYADTRAASLKGSTPVVLSGSFENTELGRVLNLTKDARWQSYLAETAAGGKTYESLIRMANENYSSIFNEFLRRNKLKLEDFDTIIGPEFVRGGNQACIRNQGIATRILGIMSPYTGGANDTKDSKNAEPVIIVDSSPKAPTASATPPSTAMRVGAGVLIGVQITSFIFSKIGDARQGELAKQQIDLLVKNLETDQKDHPELGGYITVYWQVIDHGDAGSVQTFFDAAMKKGRTEFEARDANDTSWRNLPPAQDMVTNSFWIPPAQQLPPEELPTPFNKIAIGTFAPGEKTQLQLVKWGGYNGFSGNGMFQLAADPDYPPIFAILSPPTSVEFLNGKLWHTESIDVSQMPTHNKYNIPVVTDLKAALVSPLNDDTASLFGMGIKALEIKDNRQLMSRFDQTRWVPAANIAVINVSDTKSVQDTDVYRQISLLSPNGQTLLNQMISVGTGGLKFPMEWLKEFDAIIPADLTDDEIKQLVDGMKDAGSSTLEEVKEGMRKAIAKLPSRAAKDGTGSDADASGKTTKPGTGNGLGTDPQPLPPLTDSEPGDSEFAVVAASNTRMEDAPEANFDDVDFSLSTDADMSAVKEKQNLTIHLAVIPKDKAVKEFRADVKTVVNKIMVIDDDTKSYELELVSPKAIRFQTGNGQTAKELWELTYEWNMPEQ